MMRIGLVFRNLFQSTDPAYLRRSGRALQRVLDMCVENNVDYLVEHPKTPSIFALAPRGA